MAAAPGVRTSGTLRAMALCTLLLAPQTGLATETRIVPVARPDTAAPIRTAQPDTTRPEAAQPQTDGAVVAPHATPRVGASSGQPLPRFVSIKSSEANARRGPSLTHRVDWVFRHPGMPIIVTAEYGHWRRVMDRDGLGGWVHYALLSSTRTVIVDVDMAELRRRPDRASPVIARLERGAIARLTGCSEGWCELRAGRYRGWIEDAALWGTTLRVPGADSATADAALAAAITAD